MLSIVTTGTSFFLNAFQDIRPRILYFVFLTAIGFALFKSLDSGETFVLSKIQDGSIGEAGLMALTLGISFVFSFFTVTLWLGVFYASYAWKKDNHLSAKNLFSILLNKSHFNKMFLYLCLFTIYSAVMNVFIVQKLHTFELPLQLVLRFFLYLIFLLFYFHGILKLSDNSSFQDSIKFLFRYLKANVKLIFSLFLLVLFISLFYLSPTLIEYFFIRGLSPTVITIMSYTKQLLSILIAISIFIIFPTLFYFPFAFYRDIRDYNKV